MAKYFKRCTGFILTWSAFSICCVLAETYPLSNSNFDYIFESSEGNFYLKEVRYHGESIFQTNHVRSRDQVCWKVTILRALLTEQSSEGIEIMSNDPNVTEDLAFETQNPDGSTTLTEKFHYLIEGDQKFWIQCDFITNIPIAPDSCFSFIDVNNQWSDDDRYKYRLMEVHFPFIAVGPGNIQSTPGNDLLSMGDYLLKDPSSSIAPTFPDWTYVDDRKLLWDAKYGMAPFNMYYDKDNAGSGMPYGMFLAAYNTFSYPCTFNFYRNNSEGANPSFFYDVVMYPEDMDGKDIIDDPYAGFVRYPDFLHETVFLPGDWYDGAQHYRTMTDVLKEAYAAAPTPTPGAPGPGTPVPYQVTPRMGRRPDAFEDGAGLP
jgi:hypothetical protein